MNIDNLIDKYKKGKENIKGFDLSILFFFRKFYILISYLLYILCFFVICYLNFESISQDTLFYMILFAEISLFPLFMLPMINLPLQLGIFLRKNFTHTNKGKYFDPKWDIMPTESVSYAVFGVVYILLFIVFRKKQKKLFISIISILILTALTSIILLLKDKNSKTSGTRDNCVKDCKRIISDETRQRLQMLRCVLVEEGFNYADFGTIQLIIDELNYRYKSRSKFKEAVNQFPVYLTIIISLLIGVVSRGDLYQYIKFVLVLVGIVIAIYIALMIFRPLIMRSKNKNYYSIISDLRLLQIILRSNQGMTHFHWVVK